MSCFISDLKITIKSLLGLVFLEGPDRVLSIYRIAYKYRKESCCFEEFTSRGRGPEKAANPFCVQCILHQ